MIFRSRHETPRLHHSRTRLSRLLAAAAAAADGVAQSARAAGAVAAGGAARAAARGPARAARHRRRRRRQADPAQLLEDRAAGRSRHRQRDPGARGRARRAGAGADAHGYPAQRRRQPRDRSRLPAQDPDAGAHRCRTGRPAAYSGAGRGPAGLARGRGAVPRQPRRAGGGPGRGNEPAGATGRSRPPSRSGRASPKRCRTTAPRTRPSRNWSRTALPAADGQRQAPRAHREGTGTQEPEPPDRIGQAPSPGNRRSGWRRSTADYRRQLHAERNEVQGQADKLAQERRQAGAPQGLLELRPRRTAWSRISPPTPPAPWCSRDGAADAGAEDETLRAEVWVATRTSASCARGSR
jgi:hypothetical protein